MVNVSTLTENHGVPGSNPGPATTELPANSRKRKSPGGATGALCQQRVNSPLSKRLLEVGAINATGFRYVGTLALEEEHF